MKKIFRSSYLPIAAVILISTVFAVIGLTQATTIGTNIDSSAVNASSTLQATGAVTFYGNSTFGDHATNDVNLFTGTLQASSTALFTGASTFYNTVTLSAANLKVSPGYGMDVSSSGVLNIGTTTATQINIGSASGPVVITNASSTLANFGGGTTVAGFLFGTCTPTIGSIAASSTLSAICTGSATVNSTAYKVFVTPNITNPSIIFSSASSTASGIQVSVYNTGWVAGAAGVAVDPTDNIWSWMAIK